MDIFSTAVATLIATMIAANPGVEMQAPDMEMPAAMECGLQLFELSKDMPDADRKFMNDVAAVIADQHVPELEAMDPVEGGEWLDGMKAEAAEMNKAQLVTSGLACIARTLQ